MSVVNKTNHGIHWIGIYPMDSVIHLFDNPALEVSSVDKSDNFPDHIHTEWFSDIIWKLQSGMFTVCLDWDF